MCNCKGSQPVPRATRQTATPSNSRALPPSAGRTAPPIRSTQPTNTIVRQVRAPVSRK